MSEKYLEQPHTLFPITKLTTAPAGQRLALFPSDPPTVVTTKKQRQLQQLQITVHICTVGYSSQSY